MTACADRSDALLHAIAGDLQEPAASDLAEHLRGCAVCRAALVRFVRAERLLERPGAIELGQVLRPQRGVSVRIIGLVFATAAVVVVGLGVALVSLFGRNQDHVLPNRTAIVAPPTSTSPALVQPTQPAVPALPSAPSGPGAPARPSVPRSPIASEIQPETALASADDLRHPSKPSASATAAALVAPAEIPAAAAPAAGAPPPRAATPSDAIPRLPHSIDLVITGTATAATGMSWRYAIATDGAFTGQFASATAAGAPLAGRAPPEVLRQLPGSNERRLALRFGSPEADAWQAVLSTHESALAPPAAAPAAPAVPAQTR